MIRRVVLLAIAVALSCAAGLSCGLPRAVPACCHSRHAVVRLLAKKSKPKATRAKAAKTKEVAAKLRNAGKVLARRRSVTSLDPASQDARVEAAALKLQAVLRRRISLRAMDAARQARQAGTNLEPVAESPRAG